MAVVAALVVVEQITATQIILEAQELQTKVLQVVTVVLEVILAQVVAVQVAVVVRVV
jgi:hypothetical protein